MLYIILNGTNNTKNQPKFDILVNIQISHRSMIYFNGVNYNICVIEVPLAYNACIFICKKRSGAKREILTIIQPNPP